MFSFQNDVTHKKEKLCNFPYIISFISLRELDQFF